MEQYLQLIDKFPKSTVLKISYSLFLIQYLANILGAYKYFNAASLMGCNLSQQFQIYVAKKFLNDEITNKNLYRNHIIPANHLYSKYDKQKETQNFSFIPDYEKILIYENKMNEFSTQILLYLRKQYEFWDIFTQQKISKFCYLRSVMNSRL